MITSAASPSALRHPRSLHVTVTIACTSVASAGEVFVLEDFGRPVGHLLLSSSVGGLHVRPSTVSPRPGGEVGQGHGHVVVAALLVRPVAERRRDRERLVAGRTSFSRSEIAQLRRPEQ